MKFRTPVEIEPSPHVSIDHDTPLLLLGSCFSDNMACRLVRDGFNPVANPGGALYNPASIAEVINRAVSNRDFMENELVEGPRGFHLLALATAFSGSSKSDVIEKANSVLSLIRERICPGAVCFLTFGTAWVFEWRKNGRIAGNCHKLPAALFDRKRLSVEDCTKILSPAIEALLSNSVQIVLTVSPVRHTADTLHGNTLSKATLHLACEELCGMHPGLVSYFPAYEALIDDLRDYRFTSADMKHPSEQAADYIYELFMQSYFSKPTVQRATEARKISARAAHRPILES
ncbi:MAG: GSCFA domain-containing protein [Muribaculaceae bacterium]|nr:GSCFA domain-containing protein [Muribaculaceae bacterium]